VRLNHSEHFRETPQGKGINTVSRFRPRLWGFVVLRLPGDEVRKLNCNGPAFKSAVLCEACFDSNSGFPCACSLQNLCLFVIPRRLSSGLASVTSISFTDTDSRAFYLGGTVSWASWQQLTAACDSRDTAVCKVAMSKPCCSLYLQISRPVFVLQCNARCMSCQTCKGHEIIHEVAPADLTGIVQYHVRLNWDLSDTVVKTQLIDATLPMPFRV
jgi:hypothetical protein